MKHASCVCGSKRARGYQQARIDGHVAGGLVAACHRVVRTVVTKAAGEARVGDCAATRRIGGNREGRRHGGAGGVNARYNVVGTNRAVARGSQGADGGHSYVLQVVGKIEHCRWMSRCARDGANDCDSARIGDELAGGHARANVVVNADRRRASTRRDIRFRCAAEPEHRAQGHGKQRNEQQ